METSLRRNWLQFPRTARKLAIAVAAVGLYCGTNASRASASDGQYDWEGGSPIADSPYISTDYTPAPFVVESTANNYQVAHSIADYLAGQAAHGYPIAVKINATNLDSTTLGIIFGDSRYSVKYVFADIESGSLSDTTTLISNISTAISTANSVHHYGYTNPYVGAYQAATIANDPTLTVAAKTNSTYGNTVTTTQFRGAGLTMSTPSLYAGSLGLRNAAINAGPATDHETLTGGTFPNLRSSLFILPIERLTYVSQATGPGVPLVPYVARFNNYNNGSLINGSVTVANGTDGPAAGTTAQAFDPLNPSGVGGLAESQTANQMLSRDDFEAMMLHYRLRGATGYHLFQGGVNGYTDSQFQMDALTGFNFLQNPTYGFTTGTTSIVNLGSVINNGTRTTVEDAGMIASGISDSNGKLAIFVSNVNDVSETYYLPSVISNVQTGGQSFTLVPDSHVLFLFTDTANSWQLTNGPSGTRIFNDGTGVGQMGYQNDVGIPEPTSLAVMGIGSLGLLIRVRKNKGSRRRIA